MLATRYLRTTHDDHAQWRPLSPTVRAYWQAKGHLIGEVLRPETALTLAEVVVVYAEWRGNGRCQQWPVGGQGWRFRPVGSA